MKLFYLLSLLITLPALSAENFHCQSAADSNFQASISGTRYQYDDQDFLSYQLSVEESCTDSSCLALTSHSYQFLKSRAEYQPVKYIDHHQFVLPVAVNQNKEAMGDWQLIYPYSTGANFEAHLLLGLAHLNKGVTLDLQCNGDLTESLPTMTPEQILSDVFGINSEILSLDPDLLRTYQRESVISLEDALMRALISFLNDNSATESPLAIAEFGVDIEWGILLGESAIKDFILPRAYLKQVMNDAKLELQGIAYPPEGGESYIDNWIFKLQLPTLSDHIYWAIVPKSGTGKVYNYGFN